MMCNIILFLTGSNFENQTSLHTETGGVMLCVIMCAVRSGKERSCCPSSVTLFLHPFIFLNKENKKKSCFSHYHISRNISWKLTIIHPHLYCDCAMIASHLALGCSLMCAKYNHCITLILINTYPDV